MNLSTLIAGGLPIVQALEITGDVVGSDVYKDIIMETKNRVKNGETISAVLKNFPKEVNPIFYQMVVVGEKTGTLDTSLNNIVDFYQKDIDRTLDNLIKLLEPILIIGLGVVVGGLMAAVLMPIYSMGGM
jgi:type IV pilus assembly protein PilC